MSAKIYFDINEFGEPVIVFNVPKEGNDIADKVAKLYFDALDRSQGKLLVKFVGSGINGHIGVLIPDITEEDKMKQFTDRSK